MHAGVAAYRYLVYDSSKGWNPKSVVKPNDFLPASPATAYRKHVIERDGTIGKEFYPVYVPYHPKQANPALEIRARYELPRKNAAERGTIQYVRLDPPYAPFTSAITGDPMTEGYIGVYLPPRYSASRAEPYKVLYLAHGNADDETDFMTLCACPNILDNCVARGEIEPTVMVSYGWASQGTDDFLEKYLIQKIIPYIEANFNVSKVPSGKAFGGFSAGSMKALQLWKLGYFGNFGYYVLFAGASQTLTNIGYTIDGMTNAQIDAIWKGITINTLPAGQKAPFVMFTISLFDGDATRSNAINNMNSLLRVGVPATSVIVPDSHNYGACAQSFTNFARFYMWK
jgi:hypothetical protein